MSPSSPYTFAAAVSTSPGLNNKTTHETQKQPEGRRRKNKIKVWRAVLFRLRLLIFPFVSRWLVQVLHTAQPQPHNKTVFELLCTYTHTDGDDGLSERVNAGASKQRCQPSRLNWDLQGLSGPSRYPENPLSRPYFSWFCPNVSRFLS